MVRLLRPLYVDIPVPGEGFTLAGRLDGPGGAPAAIVCHPHPAFGGTMDTPIVADIAAALVAAGMRVLRFNFRGIGGSGGRAGGGLVEDRDVRAACAFMRERIGHVERMPVDRTVGRARERSVPPAARPGQPPVDGKALAPQGPQASQVSQAPRAIEDERPLVLCGYSFGALMALKAIAQGERVKRVAAVGLPTTIVGDDPARNADIQTALAAVPTLLIAGDADQFCEAARLRAWAAAVRQTELDILTGVDHFPEGASRSLLVAHVLDFLTRDA